jgi:hypothetical protein
MRMVAERTTETRAKAAVMLVEESSRTDRGDGAMLA